MSFVNGRKYMCDRCQEETFCKCVGEGASDGGFTRWNKFEPLPEGWESRVDTGLLCSTCNGIYKSMLDNFKRIIAYKESSDG